MFQKIPALSLLMVLLLGELHASTEEPTLSNQFAYEEQLLKKVIRMELKMELMERAMQQAQDKMTNTLQNLTLGIETRTAELELREDNRSIPMVAFNAYGLADYSLDTNQIVVLQNTYINEGNGYDTVLGLFTAPTGGLYMFSFNACNYAGRLFYYQIVVDSKTIAMSTKANNVQHDCAATTTLTKLEVGQRVWVRCASGNSSPQLYDYSYTQTTFSGVLLHG